MLLGPRTTSYHIRSQLSNGGNLCGDKWAKTVADAAEKAGRKATYEKRGTPLNVSGVGHGSQRCVYDCTLPVALRQCNGNVENKEGTILIPSVQHSDLPGLLGLTTLRSQRAVLDFTTLKLHFLGPGDSKVDQSLPPGTDTFQLEIAPSGHLVLPCSEFQHPQPKDTSLTLITQARNEDPRLGLGTCSGPSGHANNRSNNSTNLPQELTFPPVISTPPTAPLGPPHVTMTTEAPREPPAIHA